MCESSNEQYKNLGKALNISDSVTFQSIIAFNPLQLNEWNLNAWKQVLLSVASISKKLSITGIEYANIINEFLQFQKSIHVISYEALSDIFRIYVNTRFILLEESVLRNIKDAYDSNKVRYFRTKTCVQKLTPLQVSERFCANPVLNTILYTLNIPNELLDQVQKVINPDYSNFQKKKYTITPERHLPYSESLNQTPIDIKTNLILFDSLQTLGDLFYYSVRYGDLKNSNLLTPDIAEYSRNIALYDENAVKQFLRSNNQLNINNANDLSIFLWFLVFYGSNETHLFSVSQDNRDEIRAIKISFSGSTQVTPTDKACILEHLASLMLQEKIDLFEERAKSAHNECLKHLKNNQKEAALIALKKQKMFEKKIETLQSGAYRIEEARHMRDATSSLALVTNVIKSTVNMAKSSSESQPEISEVLKEFGEITREYQSTQELLSTFAAPHYEEQAKVEDELKSLMASTDNVAFDEAIKKLLLPSKTAEETKPLRFSDIQI